MSETVKLTAGDGHVFDAYLARPEGTPMAALVVVQEIFGVNEHIRKVTDNLAAHGYLAVAPALFDRYERNFEAGYSGEGWKRGMAFLPKLNMEWAAADTLAAVTYARAESESAAKVGVVGYCLGGSVAWLAAAQMPIDAAVGYYGGVIAKFLDQAPKCPIILHFGEKDDHIPRSDVQAIRAAFPAVPVYLYNAGHGFNCDARESYDAPSAKLALERTLSFLAEHLQAPVESAHVEGVTAS